MPVLDTHRNIYYIARVQLLCRFAPFLIVTSSGHADEDLSAAAFGMMNMPVVTAAGFKGYIVNADLPIKYFAKSSLGAPMGKTISF